MRLISQIIFCLTHLSMHNCVCSKCSVHLLLMFITCLLWHQNYKKCIVEAAKPKHPWCLLLCIYIIATCIGHCVLLINNYLSMFVRSGKYSLTCPCHSNRVPTYRENRIFAFVNKSITLLQIVQYSLLFWSWKLKGLTCVDTISRLWELCFYSR